MVIDFAQSDPKLHQESPISSCLTLQHLAESASVARGALVASVTNLPQVRNLLASPNLPHLCVPFKVFKTANAFKVVKAIKVVQVVQDGRRVQGCQGQSR